MRLDLAFPQLVWLALNAFEGVGFSIHGLAAQTAFALHSSTNLALAFAYSMFS